MDEINKLIILYDYYGELLSDSQKEYEEKLKIIKKSDLIKEKLKEMDNEKLKQEITNILES